MTFRLQVMPLLLHAVVILEQDTLNPYLLLDDLFVDFRLMSMKNFIL